MPRGELGIFSAFTIVRDAFVFDEEYQQALVRPLGSIAVRFVTIPTLIRMKEQAGRPQDRIDIDQLRLLLKDDAVP